MDNSAIDEMFLECTIIDYTLLVNCYYRYQFIWKILLPIVFYF